MATEQIRSARLCCGLLLMKLFKTLNIDVIIKRMQDFFVFLVT